MGARLRELQARSPNRLAIPPLHDLETPREVRNALAYVLGNYKKHGVVPRDAPTLDPYSSAIWFSGWAPHVRILRRVPEDEPPTHPPATWLLREGWLHRHGPLDPNDAPDRFVLEP